MRVTQPDPDAYRRKALAILAKADSAGDRQIAAELTLLAERFLGRALELDGQRRRRSARRKRARA